MQEYFSPEINPDELPIITETSLHQIVRRVKKWQNSSESDKKYENGKYEDEDFNLIQSRNGDNAGSFLSISMYLHVEEINKKVTKIIAIGPFYWERWYFAADIQKIDQKKDFEFDENHSIVGNHIPNDGKKEAEILETLSNEAKKIYSKGKTNTPFVQYDFEIDFNLWLSDKKVVIGEIINYPYIQRVCKIYFTENVNLSFVHFQRIADWSNVVFQKPVMFKLAVFKGNVNFYKSIFQDKIFFDGVNFQEDINFNSTIFQKDINFNFFPIQDDNWYLTFLRKIPLKISTIPVIFHKNINFDLCIFESNAFFHHTIFRSKITFQLSTFKKRPELIQNKFLDEVSFRHISFEKGLSLRSQSFSGNFHFHLGEIEENQTVSVDFSNSVFEKKLYFSLANKNQYKQVNLGLYHTSFGEFVCDHRNLHQIKLKLSENLDKDEDQIEQAIQEKRVFRKILQDLHWGDFADQQYAQIMDLQTRLTGAKSIWQNVGRIFGWGVRLYDIFWSGVAFTFIFASIYLVSDVFLSERTGWRKIAENTPNFSLNFSNLRASFFDCVNDLFFLEIGRGICHDLFSKCFQFGFLFLEYLRFSIWNSFLLADLSKDYGWLITFVSTIQGVLGIVYVTVLVAIIARKFIKM